MKEQVPSDCPRLRIALEWYLNPDHLPLLWARRKAMQEGMYRMELIVPDDHYDGFEALAQGEVDLVINEPLHLLEKHQESVELISLGTFFQTDGGVLMTHRAIETLRDGGAIRVCSPVSNPVTDRLCQDILIGWGQRQNLTFSREQISVYADGFDHVKNLQAGADAAWLAFANIEGVHVRELGLPVEMISTADAGIPGFSALDLIADRQSSPEQQRVLKQLVLDLQDAAVELKANPDQALALWYEASDESPNALTRAMVNDTVGRFVSQIEPDAQRWRAIWTFMHTHGADVVSESDYEQIFKGFASIR